MAVFSRSAKRLQLMDDPHVIEREILLDLPDAELGRVAMHNVIPRLADTPGAIRTPAPGLGEHSAAILAGLGVDAARFFALAAAGVLK